MTKQNKTRTLSFRIAEDDYQRLAKLCKENELSQSKYLRYLISIPIVCDEGKAEEVSCVVLDQKTFRKISKELTRWGYHYNQAVHAMNAINYYYINSNGKTDLLDSKAESIEVELAAVNENAERIIYEIAQLQTKLLVEEQ